VVNGLPHRDRVAGTASRPRRIDDLAGQTRWNQKASERSAGTACSPRHLDRPTIPALNQVYRRDLELHGLRREIRPCLEHRIAAGATREDLLERLPLCLSRSLVENEPVLSLCLKRRRAARPHDSHDAKAVQRQLAISAFPNLLGEGALAHAERRRLTEGAWAANRAVTQIGPAPLQVPLWNAVCHGRTPLVLRILDSARPCC
jgi:hypothetical protein